MAYFEFPHTRTYDNDLGWLIKTMKEIIDNVQAQDNKIAAVEQLAQDLKDFVNNYFDNLDVQQEINHKIDIMAANGTLAAILDPQVSAATAAWLAANITQPTTPVIDASLSVSGAGADAEITGDNVHHLLDDNAAAREVYLGATNICDFSATVTRNYAAGASGTNQWIGLGWSNIPVTGGERIRIIAIDAEAAVRPLIFGAFDVRLQEYDAGNNAITATTISSRGQIIQLDNQTDHIGVLLRVSYNNTGTAYTETFKVGCAIDYAEYEMLATQTSRLASSITDLDNATDAGSYLLTYANTYAHDPSGGANTRRILFTFPGYGISTNLFKVQVLVANYDDPYNIEYYYRYQSGGTWSSWVNQVVYDFQNGSTGIPTQDFDDALKPGSYALAYGVSYANAPEDTTNTRKHLEVFDEPGATKFQRLTIYQDSTNASTKTFSRQWVRMYVSGAWRRWMLILPELENGEVESYTRAAQATQGSQNVGTKLRVMSYNLAQYNNDTAVYITDLKLQNLLKMLGQQDADIVGVQEDRANIDSANTQANTAYVWLPQYPNNSGTGGVTIHSKYTLTNQHIVKYSTSRLCRYATASIGGNTVLLVSTHPTPGITAADETARATEYQELFKFVTGQIQLENYNTAGQYFTVPTHTHTIICIDANSNGAADKSNLQNAANANSFILGNGGRFGWFYTCYKKMTSIDNIAVSNNVIINGITALHDQYDKLYSDHVPVVADVTLL